MTEAFKGATERWVEAREADWKHLPKDQKVMVEAGELQALLSKVRDRIEEAKARREAMANARAPGSPQIHGVDVRLHVELSAIITVGLYAGPVDRATVADHLDEMIARNGSKALIDKITIDGLVSEDGTEAVEMVAVRQA